MKRTSSWAITILFLCVALAGFALFISLNVTQGSGFSAIGWLVIAFGNIGFWGFIYRISKHLEVILNEMPFASAIRVILVSILAIGLITIFSFSMPYFQNHRTAEQSLFCLVYLSSTDEKPEGLSGNSLEKVRDQWQMEAKEKGIKPSNSRIICSSENSFLTGPTGKKHLGGCTSEEDIEWKNIESECNAHYKLGKELELCAKDSLQKDCKTTTNSMCKSFGEPQYSLSAGKAPSTKKCSVNIEGY